MSSLYKIYRQNIKSAQPEYWLAQSPEAVEVLRQKARRDVSNLHPVLLVLALATLVSLVCFAAAVAHGAVSELRVDPARLALIGFFGTLAVFIAAPLPLRLRVAPLVTKVLTPLSGDSSGCFQATGLVKRYESAKAYRDAVVASGRELMSIDTDCLKTLRDREFAEYERIRCLRLHDLVGDDALTRLPLHIPQPS